MAGIKGRSGGPRRNAGGRREGAGRPPGSRNKPKLIAGLPDTQDPVQWLLALVNHEGAPLRLRVNAAKALLPYFNAQQQDTFNNDGTFVGTYKSKIKKT